MMSMQAIAWQSRGKGKRFMNYYDCAIAWAYRRADDGRAGRVYFNGPTIYSYGSHFPMAHIVDEPFTVLVNSDRYSSSTSNHQSKVRTAIRHAFGGHAEFHVPTDAMQVWSGQYASKSQTHAHILALTYFAEKARESYAKSIKARSRKQSYIADYHHYVGQMEKYAKHFGVDLDAMLLAEAVEGGTLAADLASAVQTARGAKQPAVGV